MARGADEATPEFGPGFRAELETLLAWRRDVRRFRTLSVDETVVLDLLRLAQSAPSVGHSQPWRFVRLRSAAIRADVATHVDGAVAAAGAGYADPGQAAAYARLKLHGLREAPEIVAVFCAEGTRAGAGLGAATMPETREWSVVLAIHTLWLAARARGLGLGWVSILDPVALARLLTVPGDWRAVALLCLGYPEDACDEPELARAGWQPRHDWRAQVSER